jgi:parallel beta-helix repeat protein
MRKTAVPILILIALMALCAGRIQPTKAEYQGNIIINADRSISPSTAPIEKTGNIYTLTRDFTGSITVNRNNVILDGQGYTVLSDEYDEFGVVSLNKVSNVTVKSFISPYNEEKTIGISLIDASNAIVANNTITGFESVQAWNGGVYTAIYIRGGESNIIKENTLIYNLNGIGLYDSANNQIVGNHVVGNVNFGHLYSHGISIIGASNNTTYHNNFLNSTYQAKITGSANAWNDSYLGNYWSDYWKKYPVAIQIGDSGVNNIPYVIDAQNIDKHPLTQPFSNEFYAPKFPPKIAIQSPATQQLNKSSAPLTFTVDKQVNWMGYSLDGQDNITVTGNTTISELTSGLHNVTVYAIDTFGNEASSETITFTVTLEFFPTAPVIAVSAVTVIAVGLSLLIYFKKRSAKNLARNSGT